MEETKNEEQLIEKREKAIEHKKEKIKAWIKDPSNLVLFLLIALVLVVYLYYFFKLGNQPTWWDEGDYLAIATIWAQHMPNPEWLGNLLIMRPPAIPFIWSIMMRLGLGELSIRFFTELLPALASVVLIYLLGKGMFNKSIGAISAAILSFNWVFMFYSFRLLTDTPALFFALLSLYFFWVKYEKPYIDTKKENLLYLCLSVAFGIFAFMARYAAVLVIISIAIYLIITRNFSALKNKNLWIALLIGLLVLSPLFIYYYLHFGNIFPSLGFYHGAQSGSKHFPFTAQLITAKLPNFLSIFTYILFLIGFFLLLEFIFYFDLILKQKEGQKNNLFFCFIGILCPAFYFIFGIRIIDERYLVSVCPLIILTAAYGLSFISEKLSNLINYKALYIILIILVSGIIMYQQFSMASGFINNHLGSYGPIQEAGLWLRDNSPKDAKILTASTVQILYYSERQTYVLWGNNTGFEKCFDFNGNLNTNETCMTGTEKSFDEKVKSLKPDYMIVHIFEPVFTPQWAYDYPQRHNLTFVKAFGSYNGGPALVIYQFGKTQNG